MGVEKYLRGKLLEDLVALDLILYLLGNIGVVIVMHITAEVIIMTMLIFMKATVGDIGQGTILAISIHRLLLRLVLVLIV